MLYANEGCGCAGACPLQSSGSRWGTPELVARQKNEPFALTKVALSSLAWQGSDWMSGTLKNGVAERIDTYTRREIGGWKKMRIELLEQRKKNEIEVRRREERF